MQAPLSPTLDSFIENAINSVPVASRNQAVEIAAAHLLPVLNTGFKSIQRLPLDALAALPNGEFDFILATRAFDEISYVAPVVTCFRESSRILREHGIFCANLNNLNSSPIRFSMGELADLARDLDFQVLAIEGAGSNSMSFVWRKRDAGWRVNLADHAMLASARITHIANAWDKEPVVPSRGRYAAISISVQNLPMDLDLLDLEILTGGIRANAVSISEPDAKGLRQIHAILPSLEQTGLIPVELRWFGEPLTNGRDYVRVIPPGPIVPRIARVSAGATRRAGISVLIEELARPDEVTMAINDIPVWGLEALSVDPSVQSYDLRFQIPEEIPPGIHQIQVLTGRRKLPPITVEIQ